MIKFLGKLPTNCVIACSGGVDSMAALSFLTNNSSRKVAVAYFDHGTKTGKIAKDFLSKYCEDNYLPLVIRTIENERDKKQSLEEYWRNERYAFLHSFNLPVVTAHHLGDQMENWIFSSMHGNGKLMPYSNKNVIRPFLATPKSELIAWCRRRNVPWVDDASNQDVAFMRNKIRHQMMPLALQINPGLEKVIKKKVLSLSLEQPNAF